MSVSEWFYTLLIALDGLLILVLWNARDPSALAWNGFGFACALYAMGLLRHHIEKFSDCARRE